jgi:hypothetical protein
MKNFENSVKKMMLFLLIGIFLLAIVTATVITLTFNSPADNHITGDNFKLLNITIYNNDTSRSTDVKIYGSNNSIIANNSLIYRKSNVTNGTTITFNWTSPKLKTSDNPNIVLLMYFDNQTGESNETEIGVDNNMVLYFKFNNDSSVGESYTSPSTSDVVYDYSPAKKNGTTQNAISYLPTGGKFAGAFNFDGTNDQIVVEDNIAGDPLDITSNLTIETWINLDTLRNSDDILLKTSAYNLRLSPTTPFTSISFGVWVPVTQRTLNADLGLINTGAWHHIAATYESNTLRGIQRIYVDGREVKSTTLTGLSSYTIDTNNNNLIISGSDNLDGKVDNVALYNRTLSAGEIRDHAWRKVIDETGKNNGTRESGVGFNYSGKIGASISLDNNNYVSISDDDSLDLNQSFSISFWAYPTDLSKNQTFLAKGSGTTTNYYIDYKTNNKVEFGFYNGAWKSLAVDASTFTVNKWNLITATRNASTNISKVYINGVDKGSLQIGSSHLANSNDLKIGYFPSYNQNYTGLIDELIIYNKTINSSEVNDIYQLKQGNWNWKFSAEDSVNLNMSATRTFEIGSVWTVSPADLGSISSALNVNVSAGTLTINNTHASRNVTINITSNYSGVLTFNKTLPFNLTGAGGNWTQVQINVTSPITEGLITINLNITATDYSGADSVPVSRIVPVVLAATSANPYLITNFETYPTIVSQNNTGISLKASVTNRGQGNAQAVSLTFALPNGWANSSGALTQGLGLLLINEQKNASIIADINSNATTGTATLYANISAQNSTGSDLSSSYLSVGSASIDVNAVSAGVGPTVITITTETASSTGGGGGSAVGTGVESIVYSKTIEIVRGKEDIFDIEVYNKYLNSSLEDLILSLTGFLSQYIEISPSKIDKINPKETKKFSVKLKIPAYKETYEENTLKAVISGYKVDGTAKKSYTETQNIKLIIQEVSRGESDLILSEAEKAILEMENAGFNIQEVSRLFEQAKLKLSENRNKEAQVLSQQIINLRDKAFSVNGLIKKILEALKNPRKTNLLTGNVAKEIVDENGEKVSINSVLTGKAIFSGESAENVLNMAIAAFKRGDFSTAEERAKSAQVLLLLERKGNFGLFLYLYWYFVLFGFLIFSFAGVLSYRKYQKSSITIKIQDIDKKEDNIRNLLASSQKHYFSGKISAGEYHRIMNQHQNKLAKIKQERLKLRNKRIKMLKQQEILQDLGIERLQVESEIKKLQEKFYRDRKISESEYKTEFNILNERLAEIEGEKITLEMLKQKKSFGAQIDSKDELKKGVLLINNKIIDILKEEVSKRNCRGKWIRLNLKSKEEGKK